MNGIKSVFKMILNVCFDRYYPDNQVFNLSSASTTYLQHACTKINYAYQTGNPALFYTADLRQDVELGFNYAVQANVIANSRPKVKLFGNSSTCSKNTFANPEISPALARYVWSYWALVYFNLGWR